MSRIQKAHLCMQLHEWPEQFSVQRTERIKMYFGQTGQGVAADRARSLPEFILLYNLQTIVAAKKDRSLKRVCVLYNKGSQVKYNCCSGSAMHSSINRFLLLCCCLYSCLRKYKEKPSDQQVVAHFDETTRDVDWQCTLDCLVFKNV